MRAANYSQGELSCETKHGYLDGYVYAITGTSKNFGRLMSNNTQKK